MTTNEVLPPALKDTPLYEENPGELFALLQERAARYTMGDSTSIPVETASRLLEGILYCLRLQRNSPLQESAGDAPLRLRWQAGVQEAKRLAKRAKFLYREAQRMQPPVVNTAFVDSIDAIGGFFRAYDADFFAQEIPCSFDYPLCHPVPDTLSGVEYLLEYLRRWLAESAFLRAFPADALRALYKRYYKDYIDLLVNLFLPAAEMAALCALAGQPVSALALGDETLAAVERKLTQAGGESARASMIAAADRALEQMNIGGVLLSGYMRQTALDLLVRLRVGDSGS